MNLQTDLLHFSRHHGNPVWLSLWEETRGEQYSLVSGVCLSVSQSVSLPFLIMRVRPVRAKAAQSHKAILSRRSHVRIYSVSIVFLRLLSLSLLLHNHAFPNTCS